MRLSLELVMAILESLLGLSYPKWQVPGTFRGAGGVGRRRWKQAPVRLGSLQAVSEWRPGAGRGQAAQG